MKVKIGNTWYNSKDIDICIQLTDTDKENLKELILNHPERSRYAIIKNVGQGDEAMREWMRDAPERGDYE